MGVLKKLIPIFAIIICLAQYAFGVGALYARRAGSNETGESLWLKTTDTRVTVVDQMAITHVDQVFKNEDNYAKEGVLVFPLPENAIVTELALWINGVRVLGQVMESDTARAIYDSIVRQSIDPALLEYLGGQVFKLSIFPIEAATKAMSERRVEITYAELLPYDLGTVNYHFFMESVNLSSRPVQRATFALELWSQKRILSLTSPSHGTSAQFGIIKDDDYHYSVIFGDENTQLQNDLVLQYQLENLDYECNHLTYVPNPDSFMFFDSTGDNPYFLLWVTPPTQVSQAQVLKKDLVLLPDISGSMAGARIAQVRSSLNAMVDQLNPGDRFNIIPYATFTMPFRPGLTLVSDSVKTGAHAFINQLTEGGLTNMSAALRAGLRSAWRDTSVNALVFLTDGTPTWPSDILPDSILRIVNQEDTQSVAVHAFGIGDEVQKPFLVQLARDHNGFYQFINNNDSISSIMNRFLARISYPLIRNASLTYGGLDYYDIFPRQIPNLYWGGQLTMLGRYRGAGTYPLTFNGRVGSTAFSLKDTLTYPSAVANQPFVPRMWASAKIDFLLEEISVFGEQTALVDMVKFLGKKYSIITPYTSMLVIGPVNITTEDKTAAKVKETALYPNSPNPFNPSTEITYALPRFDRPQAVNVRIYDLKGRLVRTLVNEYTMGGSLFRVTWNGRDNNGKALGSGTYLAVLNAGPARKMIRMNLVK